MRSLNIYIRSRFKNADSVINKVRIFADFVEGRGYTSPDVTPRRGCRVRSISASPFPTGFSIGWHPCFGHHSGIPAVWPSPECYIYHDDATHKATVGEQQPTANLSNPNVAFPVSGDLGQQLSVARATASHSRPVAHEKYLNDEYR